MKQLILLILILPLLLSADTINTNKSGKAELLSKIQQLLAKKEKLKDSVIVLKNSFDYRGKQCFSEIKHRMFGETEITYYHHNGKKWMQFSADPGYGRINEPVMEWDPNGTLLHTGIENVSVSKDTFAIHGGICYGLCATNALSGHLSGKVALKPDTSITVRLYSEITFDLDTTYKHNAKVIRFWVRYPDTTGWKTYGERSSSNSAPPTSSLATSGKNYNKPVSFYVQYESEKGSNKIPDKNTKPMLIVIRYLDQID
jgi:hypothetical protein